MTRVTFIRPMACLRLPNPVVQLSRRQFAGEVDAHKYHVTGYRCRQHHADVLARQLLHAPGQQQRADQELLEGFRPGDVVRDGNVATASQGPANKCFG